MTSDRIKEIQLGTAYPDSISVGQALFQVWKETRHECALKIRAEKTSNKELKDELELALYENKRLKDMLNKVIESLELLKLIDKSDLASNLQFEIEELLKENNDEV